VRCGAHRLVIAHWYGVLVLPTGLGPSRLPIPAEAHATQPSIESAACQGLRGAAILIVGGVLTSGHLALVPSSGGRVTLVPAGPVAESKTTSTQDPGWLGPNYLKTFVLNLLHGGRRAGAGSFANGFESRPARCQGSSRRASQGSPATP